MVQCTSKEMLVFVCDSSHDCNARKAIAADVCRHGQDSKRSYPS